MFQVIGIIGSDDMTLVKRECLDTNKAAWKDTIPSKLIKIAAEFLTPLLIAILNKSIGGNIFPDSAKIASLVTFDKGKLNINEISNFKPISLWNIF